jgi:uncharacterized protein YuzE
MADQRFELESSIDSKTGRTVAVYLRVRSGTVAQTVEVVEGVVFADYDSQGILLGVELLGPCHSDVLDRIGQNEPEPIRHFLRGGAPHELVEA